MHVMGPSAESHRARRDRERLTTTLVRAFIKDVVPRTNRVVGLIKVLKARTNHVVGFIKVIKARTQRVVGLCKVVKARTNPVVAFTKDVKPRTNRVQGFIKDVKARTNRVVTLINPIPTRTHDVMRSTKAPAARDNTESDANKSRRRKTHDRNRRAPPRHPQSRRQTPPPRHHRRSSALEIPDSNLMNREQSIVTFAISNVCLWLVVLLHRFTDMKDVVWLVPFAGIASSISLCLMLYLYFKAKGTKPL